MVEAAEREFGRVRRQLRLLGVGRELFGKTQSGGAAEHHEVDQRVGAEAIGAVHGDASRFADRHQAGDDGVVVAVPLVSTSP